MGSKGGGGKKGGSPAPPNFAQAAQQQSISSRPNTYNPFGSQTWSMGPGGQMTSQFNLNPQMQNVMGNLQGGMLSGSTLNPATAGQDAFNKVYGAFQSRLDPAWQNRQQAFNTRMEQMGAAPGSQAFGNASRAFGQQMNDAYQQAMGSAVGAGQAEQVQARANAMLPYQQAGGVMGLLGDMGNLGQGAPMLSAAQNQYNAAMNSQEAQNNKKGSALGGLGSIAGTLFGGPLGGTMGGLAGGALGGNLGGGLTGGGGMYA